MTTPTKEQEAKLMEEIFIPIIKNHGLEKGAIIATELGKTLASMDAWPADVKEACMEELLRIMELAKIAAAAPNNRISDPAHKTP